MWEEKSYAIFAISRFLYQSLQEFRCRLRNLWWVFYDKALVVLCSLGRQFCLQVGQTRNFLPSCTGYTRILAPNHCWQLLKLANSSFSSIFTALPSHPLRLKQFDLSLLGGKLGILPPVIWSAPTVQLLRRKLLNKSWKLFWWQLLFCPHFVLYVPLSILAACRGIRDFFSLWTCADGSAFVTRPRGDLGVSASTASNHFSQSCRGQLKSCFSFLILIYPYALCFVHAG